MMSSLRPWLYLSLLTVAMYGLLFLAGCTQEALAPPVPPPPDDLSGWSVPALVQPPAPEPVGAKPVEEKPTAAEKVYGFAVGGTYTVPVAVGSPLDIVLERGEDVRNIVGGDRAPVEQGQPAKWEVKQGGDGHGDTARGHIFLTATEPGLTIGLVVTSTKRTYYLTCKSVNTTPTRVVRWTYGPPVPEVQKPKAPELLPDLAQPTRWHVGYTIESKGPRPEWVPAVFDDGHKMYLVFNPVVLYTNMPLIREVTSQGPSLLNARQIDNVVIVDKLAPRLELRYGTGEHAEVLLIVRGNLRTISCPEHVECPARRMP